MKSIVRVLIIASIVTACGKSTDDTPPPVIDDGDDFVVDLSDCPMGTSRETMDILTWNIEQFPKDNMTSAIVQEVISQSDPDLIAVQEITSVSAFNQLISELDGWEGMAVRYNDSNLMLGYLYKSSEISLNGSAIQLYEEDTDMNNDAFTAFRRPLMINVTHNPSGLQAYVINIHLKCCNGSEDRRRGATSLLKSYIDQELADEAVIVLGDYNDDIIDEDNVFEEFIADADNYYFTTTPVAEGESSEWSYPSFPSQIDNILITNELFDNEVETKVQTIDLCFGGFNVYESFLSDHRPVLIRLQSN